MGPSSAYRLIRRASGMFIQGRIEEAEILIRQALGVLPRSPRVRILAGDIFSETVGAHRALREYNAAIRLAPTAAEAYLAKANFLLGNGDAHRAESLARKALRIAEQRPTRRNSSCLDLIYDVLSDALLENGDRPGAVIVVKHGLRLTRSPLPLPLTRSDPGVLMRRDPPGRRDFLSK
jgi:tetratricopeptide (TPR) repeat protein